MKPLCMLLLAGIFVGALPVLASDDTSKSLEPCINGSVSASGTFPTQAMENQLAAYVEWTRKNGLPVDYALLSVSNNH